MISNIKDLPKKIIIQNIDNLDCYSKIAAEAFNAFNAFSFPLINVDHKYDKIIMDIQGQNQNIAGLNVTASNNIYINIIYDVYKDIESAYMSTCIYSDACDKI